MPAYRAAPAGKTGLPVVLVISEIFGVHEYIADTARRLARAGYLAIAPELPPVEADEARLEVVLRNLLANAMKFTPQGGQISLSASENGDFIRFEISDSGAGIEAGRLASLFASAEFAAKTQMPAANEGTGLGLIICKDFVETNGGKIGVQVEFSGVTAEVAAKDEFVALAEKLQAHYGAQVDFVGWISTKQLDEIIALTVGDLVAFIAART